jgi:prepilin-type N-terminal cleavage/methylation domain-containing protein
VLTDMRNPRGFTLIELLIALVIMGVVSGALYTLLNRSQRLTRAQTEQLNLQSSVRSASLVVPSELREINTVVGAVGANDPQVDIIDKQLTSVTYRAMRGMGIVCQTATANEIRVYKDQGQWSGYRNPEATRDGVYIFIENDKDKTTDDVWQQEAVTAVNLNSNCGGGVSAIAFTISPNLADPAGVPKGTPVRTYEVMKLGLYVSDGKSWLGAQSVSGGDASLQPLLGPLRDANGFGLQYLNATGGVAALPSDVKSIVLTIRGVSDHVASRSGGSYTGQIGDSLVTQVSLRNAFRP